MDQYNAHQSAQSEDDMKITDWLHITGPLWSLDAIKGIIETCGGRLRFRVGGGEAVRLGAMTRQRSDDGFRFEIGQRVELTIDRAADEVRKREAGVVIGRASFSYCDRQYQVRYVCGDGRMIESWWTESALRAA